jgi:sec-independent protein translocase protein TatB
MLPSLGFQEILLLGIIALVVVGPKDLPLMLRKLGRWTARLRAMAQEFRSGFDELARQAELDELKKEVEALRRNQTLSDLRDEMSRPITQAYEEALGLKPDPATAQLDEPFPQEGEGGRAEEAAADASAAAPLPQGEAARTSEPPAPSLTDAEADPERPKSPVRAQ